MKGVLCGVRHSEYDSKKGQRVSGWNLYMQYRDLGVDGFAAAEIWVSDRLLHECEPDWLPAVGDCCAVSYSRRGYVEDVAYLERSEYDRAMERRERRFSGGG